MLTFLISSLTMGKGDRPEIVSKKISPRFGSFALELPPLLRMAIIVVLKLTPIVQKQIGKILPVLIRIINVINLTDFVIDYAVSGEGFDFNCEVVAHAIHYRDHA